MKILLNSSAIHTSIHSGLKRLNPKQISRKFRRDEDGIAAIEFAIIAPVMIGMYFQQPEIRDTDIEEIVSAALRVMNISDINNVSMDIESFILPDADQPPESRGRIRVNNSAGGFTNFDASGLDEKILNARSGVVVTRATYKYTPLQLRFLNTDVTLKETFLLKPRRSDAVQIQDGIGSLIDCTATSFSNVTCTVTS